MDNIGVCTIYRRKDDPVTQFAEKVKETYEIIYKNYSEVIGVFPFGIDNGDTEYVIVCR